jgi:hypothetical protein
VTAYDLQTAGFLRESPRVGIDSYDRTVHSNGDGSLDVTFGPAPVNGDPNWIYTAPGKGWFAMFRFYGPAKPLFDKTWALTDIELIGGIRR